MASGTLIKGTQLHVCAVPQNSDLSVPQFAALTWVLVCCPNTSPSFSEEAEIVSEFCISGEEVSAVGAATGAETEVSVFYQAACQGQDILRNNFGGTNALAFRKTYADSPNPTTTTNTVIYTRALITSWGDNDGSVNEFITNTYGLKLVQKPILVKPAAI